MKESRALRQGLASLRALCFHTNLSALALNATAGSLEDGLDALLDNGARMLLDAYAPAIPSAIDGIFGGPVRAVLQAALARNLAQR